ncbi:MAG: hypothetical protein ABI921_02015 [Panacibacter sp.]
MVFVLLVAQQIVYAQLVNLYNCKVKPIFISRPEINFKVYAISTSDRFYKGVVLLNGDTTAASKSKKVYQHETWKQQGAFGSFIITEHGDIFVIPVPSINVLENPKQQQNTIYKIDAVTGILKPFIKLPAVANANAGNPFGLLGLAYDCTTKVLYASTVYNSTMKDELGVIYAIDTKAKMPAVIDSLNNTDALGLYIAMLNGRKICIYSSARKSVVSAVSVDTSGRFITAEKSVIISLDNIGPRGDDKVRKLRVTDNQQLLLYGVAFNWNLIAPTEKQESEYMYLYDRRLNRLVLANITSAPPSLGY